MVGATGLQCPECGHTVRHAGEFFRTRRRWRLAILSTLTALGTPGYGMGVRRWDDLALAILPRWQSAGEQQIGPYMLELSVDRRAQRPMRVRILRDGEPEFTLRGWYLGVGAKAAEGAQAVGVGEDITGEGIPNLILTEWTGGAHCCWRYHVFSLDPEDGPRVLTVIHAGHSDEAPFQDLDGDGRLECVLRDWTFAYWKTCFAASPAPQVILCYRGGQYVVASHLMVKPAPGKAELMQLARRVRERPSVGRWSPGSVPEEYWTELLELVYAGHETLAWKFADEAWPAECPGKQEFLAEFRQQLAESPYWPGIRAVGLP